MNASAKLKYLFTAIKCSLSKHRKRCPACKTASSLVLDRKWLFTALRRCPNCDLLYRTPITTSEENRRFYQHEYKQGSTTDCPSESELADLLEKKFSNTERDYGPYISLIKSIGLPKGARILDYGCSWGYGSWQLTNSGYDVTAFEISEPRALYAKTKLGVKVFVRWEEINEGDFDLFFSSHVLEHVPSPLETFQLAKGKLRPGGLFLAFTPNGSAEYRVNTPVAWRKLWGLVHPNFLDAHFYRKHFPSVILSCAPYDCERIKDCLSGDKGGTVGALDSYELMALVKF